MRRPKVGEVYILPSSSIHEGAVILVLEETNHWVDVPCLMLDTGQCLDVRDWFFSSERRIM